MLEFWALTPAETFAFLDAARERTRREHEGRAWAVWHTAALQRYKRLPGYKQFIRPPTPAAVGTEELQKRAEAHAELEQAWRKKHE